MLAGETHSFEKINAIGEVEILGTIDGDTGCIHHAMEAMAQRSPRLASPYDVAALMRAIDDAFHACETAAGEVAVGRVAYGCSTVRCTRTLH